jgi:aspartate carbamoyltransferase catalytic subunit
MRLGMRVTGFAGTEGTSVQKGESLRHTLDMYEAYDCDALIMRHPLDGSARFAADHLGIPVFNAGDGKHEHPTQTLLDLFTIREHLGRLTDFDLAIAGDLKYGRTAHSLALALTMFEGVRLHLFSHPELALPENLVKAIRARGVEIVHHDDIGEAGRATDILYQTRIQKERMPDPGEFERAKEMSEFTLEMLESTRPGFGLMHPLPIDKTAPSISPAIDGHPKAIYKVQAGNGVPTRLTELAVSLGLLGADFRGETHATPAHDTGFFEEAGAASKPPREDMSIRPIRDRGVVIDHMQPYAEDLLVRLLRVRERKDIYRAATVRARARMDSVKGMLMIEDRDLTEKELRLIAAVSPGCTVNLVQEAKVVKKLRMRLPALIEDVAGIRCTNKGCITRAEHLEHVKPIMVRFDEHNVRCHFCDNVIPSSQMF